MFDSFGNKVRIKSSLETEERQLAGKIGEVYGQTTPSMMDLEIIGTQKEDFAVNVFFEDLDESFWFDSELLEDLDNGEGAVITLDGIDKKWTKDKDGQWIEENNVQNKDQSPKIDATTSQSKKTKKWWNFWN
jgi:hypothetical protein